MRNKGLDDDTERQSNRKEERQRLSDRKSGRQRQQ